MTTTLEKVNGAPSGDAATSPAGPRTDPRAEAEAEAIRARTAAETEATRLKAAAEADAIRTKAAEEKERLRIANERARMKLEKDQAAHAAYLAEKKAKEEAANASADRARKQAEADAERAAKRAAEQRRAERVWKWGARGIYAIGLIIAGPVQFMHFWDPKRPFLLAAPALLEGFALALAFGAAWAVAHRRDVAPYRAGIMLGAAIAAGINLHGGMTNTAIGLNAGLIGAIASLGGPAVLMVYEHGIAQKADGIPSWRDRRAADRAKAEEDAAREKARQEKAEAEKKAAVEKEVQQARAEQEQSRRDEDRRHSHTEVWAVADAMRSARGAPVVTEQIWAEAWYRVTGCKTVGITPEMESRSRAAQARMKTVAEVPVLGEFTQIESQKVHAVRRDPDAPDGRRFNGGTPPRRTPGDTPPYSPLAKKQASIEQTARTAVKEAGQ
ncbi:hypothetical protein AB0B15_14290 [Streptomyces sp. NPDC045456]|uniref:hypothetical protein n=1 Tax=Streptomyces sp. NPDC045456 TaxID=3155254 RepID=UPI0033D523B6